MQRCIYPRFEVWIYGFIRYSSYGGIDLQAVRNILTCTCQIFHLYISGFNRCSPSSDVNFQEIQPIELSIIHDSTPSDMVSTCFGICGYYLIGFKLKRYDCIHVLHYRDVDLQRVRYVDMNLSAFQHIALCHIQRSGFLRYSTYREMALSVFRNIAVWLLSNSHCRALDSSEFRHIWIWICMRFEMYRFGLHDIQRIGIWDYMGFALQLCLGGQFALQGFGFYALRPIGIWICTVFDLQ